MPAARSAIRQAYGRTPVQRNGARQRVSATAQMPAPVGGWDTQSPLANMQRDRAVVLDNWIPRNGFVEMRKGYEAHRTGVGAPVQTLMVYRSPTTEEMFAAAGSIIYNVTATGSAVSAEVSSLANARWQYVNFATPGGNFLRAVNGQDTPLVYNGTSWTVTPAVTASGLAATSLIDVFAHKQRLYFIQANSQSFWYLAPIAIGGTAESYNLGTIFNKGGSIVAGGTWSIDGGSGPDDLAVFLSSEGQVAIYSGIDPGSAADWALVGVFDISRPIGRRCLVKLGGDLGVLTEGGMIPLSQAIVQEKEVADRIAITANINNAFQKAAARHRSKFGWQVQVYERGELMVVNVPTAESAAAEQYVMNATTGAWCRFTGWNANCFAVFAGNLYFGGASAVYRADTGYSDGGAPITADGIGAYNAFGRPGTVKKFEMLRPILRAGLAVAPSVGMAVDFKDRGLLTTPSIDQIEAPLWGSALWGSALWSQTRTIRIDWTGSFGIGVYGAPIIRAVSNVTTDGVGTDSTVELVGFDVLFQPGGVL